MLTQLKRLITVVGTAAVVAVPVSAMAQQPATTASTSSSSQRHEGIGIGAKIGPLFSTLSQKDVSFQNRTGWIGGLFLGGNRAGVVGVGVDLLFARKGGKDDFGDAVNLDYINVPVYMRINGGSSSASGGRVYGIVGVDLNFLLKAKDDSPNTAGNDVTKDFNRADYGVALGLGGEFARFIVEGRYTKGLGNIAKNKSADDLKTQSFAIMFGVRFN